LHNKNDNPVLRYKSIYFLIIYLLYLGSITLRPFEFSLLAWEKYFSYSLSKQIALLFQLDLFDFFLNIILFIPFGVLLFYILKNFIHRHKTVIYIPVVLGILLSTCIEVLQILTDRFTSFWDVISNMLGTVLGFQAMKNSYISHKTETYISGIWNKRLFRLSLLVMYIFFIFIILYYPYRRNTVKNWNTSYPLLLGNEATFDRPWKGEIFSVALYNQRLSYGEVEKLYRLDYESTSVNQRKGSGLVLLYDFSEGSGNIIYDKMDTGSSVNLKAENIIWIENQGIRFNRNSRVQSINDTEKLINILQSTSEMSIEVWFRTLDVTQTGPARIISLSINPNRRNFTLGQNGQDIHLRVRTPLTGLNGSKINLVSYSVLGDMDIHHITAVFDHGTERVFLDGKPAPDLIRADIHYLPCIFGLGISYFSRICFYFLIFFPLGFLISQFSSKYKLSFTIIIILLIVSVEQSFYHICTGQSFTIELLLYGILFSLIHGVYDHLFLKKAQTVK